MTKEEWDEIRAEELAEEEHPFAQCWECKYGGGERPCTCSYERNIVEQKPTNTRNQPTNTGV
jgi:hypothetical protein